MFPKGVDQRLTQELRIHLATHAQSNCTVVNDVSLAMTLATVFALPAMPPSSLMFSASVETTIEKFVSTDWPEGRARQDALRTTHRVVATIDLSDHETVLLRMNFHEHGQADAHYLVMVDLFRGELHNLHAWSKQTPNNIRSQKRPG